MQCTQESVLQASLRWTTICCVSASLSFMQGVDAGYSTMGMAWGVLTFIALYVMFDHHPFRKKLTSMPHVLQSAYFAYGLRMFMSLALVVPIVLGLEQFMDIDDTIFGMVIVPFAWVDLLVGAFSIELVESFFTALQSTDSVYPELLTPPNTKGVLPTYLITLVDGALLNVIVLLSMGVAYSVLRLIAIARGKA